MALLFSSFAKHSMPAGPMCLSKCRGIWLRPELLSAFKCSDSTELSSNASMCCRVASRRGEY
jgi:hypothetical protein